MLLGARYSEMSVDQELLVLRRLAFGFEKAPPSRTFYADDVFLSQFWGSLSLLFPQGERFFVDSVKHYQREVGDPILRARITGFAGQESMHGKEHETFNQYFFDRDMEHMARRVDEDLAHIFHVARTRFSPEFQLGITCALEHFTAILAEQLLTMPEHEMALDPKTRRLWLWHALEELEHKSVAYDVYQQVSGKYVQRVLSMIAATAIFVWFVQAINRSMLKRQPKGSVRFRPFLRTMFVTPALIPRLIPTYMRYFRPRFHPDDYDTSDLVATWRKKLFEGDGPLASILERSNVVAPRATPANL